MVHAGEQAGNLEQVLERLADFGERQVKLQNKVIAAMAYPAFMLVVGTIMVWIMLVVVVPKVMNIFESFNQVLPLHTRILIWTSTFLQDYWWLLLILVSLATWAFITWKRRPRGRATWDRFKLRAPIFGKLGH